MKIIRFIENTAVYWKALSILDIYRRKWYFFIMIKKDITFMIAAAVVAGLLVIAWKSGPLLPEPAQEEQAAALPVETADTAVNYREMLYAEGQKIDLVMECYRNTASREDVIGFFSELTGSKEVALAILAEADAFDISPALAFSLAWEESRYKPHAESKQNGNLSVDRGLFQLNSYSFPELSETDFFNPRINARCGLSHLRWCLETGGSEISALAMYNAGLRRVSTGGTPKRTLDYISRILVLRENIETLFEIERPREPVLTAEQKASRSSAPSIAEEEKPPREPRGFFRVLL
jgi:soluble lytic murein transglycosylase-like protein